MGQRLTRNISLTPELDRYLLARVETGAYSTVSEVVRVAIRLLQEREPSPATAGAVAPPGIEP